MDVTIGMSVTHKNNNETPKLAIPNRDIRDVLLSKQKKCTKNTKVLNTNNDYASQAPARLIEDVEDITMKFHKYPAVPIVPEYDYFDGIINDFSLIFLFFHFLFLFFGRKRLKIENSLPIPNLDTINLQPIYISEIMSIRFPGSLQYEIFWIVSNFSNLSFGRNSTFKRLIKIKLTKEKSNGIEMDNQEIKYLEANRSIQITSKLLLERNNEKVQKFTVTLQIGDSNDQPNKLKTIQTRKFTIKPPLIKNIQHLFLDVTKSECNNLDDSNTSFYNYNGSIDLILSKAVNGKYSVKGLIKFDNGIKINLNH
jgi:hypothetical protein